MTRSVRAQRPATRRERPSAAASQRWLYAPSTTQCAPAFTASVSGDASGLQAVSVAFADIGMMGAAADASAQAKDAPR